MEFQKQHIIDFLNISLSTTPGQVCGVQSKLVNKLPKSFNGLTVKASVGMGYATEIPWISFTGYNQKTSNGIYPVLLFYHKINIIIVAFGVSATKKPAEMWNISGLKSLDQFFTEQQIPQTGVEKKYNASFVHSVFPVHVKDNKLDESKFSVDKVLGSIKEVCEIFKKHFEGKKNAETSNKKSSEELFSIKKIIGYIKDTGLLYNSSLIKRFAFSLMSKRFLILSGLAGSGKTQLALAFASALVENKDKQMCVVSVGADWTNREPLLGFPNALQSGKYVKPESGVLDLLIEANREENANKPFFLIMDEMNMSYVERYFADFLSAMESKEKISLWNTDAEGESGTEIDGVPQRIDLPKNLFIIGTINVDETTYMFSPKVLDRANVIEFKISTREMGDFLEKMHEIDRDSIISKAAGMGPDFVAKACKKNLDKDKIAIETLQKFFNELKNVNAEFGYRSATEIFRFICQTKANDDTDKRITDMEILDAAIVQKLLPKLHGSRKKLEPVLTQLCKLCFTVADKDLNISMENVKKAQFKESADKIRRMYESAIANGFTSFAEA